MQPVSRCPPGRWGNMHLLVTLEMFVKSITW
jgi:hypothetical protein